MSLFNDDELTPPSWINEEFVSKVLTEYHKDKEAQIIKFELSPASMKGDHFASIMFRCKVSYKFSNDENQTLNKSIIIKTLPVEDGMKREMLVQTKFFETEIDMYSQTLPEMQRILSEHGDPTKLCAEIIYSSLQPHKVIILEDLCEAGYDVVRDRYLSEDEIKAVYSKVAKLHAVSYMLGQSENHQDVAKYQEGVLSNSMMLENPVMASGVRNLIEMLSCHEDLDVYYEKLKIMEKDIFTKSKELYRAYNLNKSMSGGDIFVLNHGDFHLKNLMFKFSKQNQVEDLIMVDYQLSCFAPSNIDLTYSQFMMLSPELRLKRNELSQYYFTEFTDTLKKIQFKGDMPKFSDFQMSALKYRHFTIFLLSTFLPMVAGLLGKTTEELAKTDTVKFFENPDMFTMTYRMPAFVEDIRRLMPIFLAEGYLD